jgi:hypothetical protein
LIESGVRFARPFVTPFNVINETAIRSLCGGKAKSYGCLQIRSRLRATNRARTREIGRPNKGVRWISRAACSLIASLR